MADLQGRTEERLEINGTEATVATRTAEELDTSESRDQDSTTIAETTTEVSQAKNLGFSDLTEFSGKPEDEAAKEEADGSGLSFQPTRIHKEETRDIAALQGSTAGKLETTATEAPAKPQGDDTEERKEGEDDDDRADVAGPVFQPTDMTKEEPSDTADLQGRREDKLEETNTTGTVETRTAQGLDILSRRDQKDSTTIAETKVQVRTAEFSEFSNSTEFSAKRGGEATNEEASVSNLLVTKEETTRRSHENRSQDDSTIITGTVVYDTKQLQDKDESPAAQAYLVNVTRVV